mgnify:CR=1 FL=1
MPVSSLWKLASSGRFLFPLSASDLACDEEAVDVFQGVLALRKKASSLRFFARLSQFLSSESFLIMIFLAYRV